MSYKITVEKTSLETRRGQSEYVKLADTGGKDGGAEFGYVHKPNQQVEINRVVYTQFVEELDLLAVINAVNKGAA
jgi:cell fate (sporulation/competence/biofilm development) regulator YlbF (YheA/YmcA/DUF963 family)